MLKILFNINSLLDYHRTGIPYYTWHLLNEMNCHPEIAALYGFNDNRIKKYFPAKHPKKLSFLHSLTNQLEKKQSVKKIFSKFKFNKYETFIKSSLAQNFTYLEPNFIVKPFEGHCITTLHDLTCIRFPSFQPEATVKWFEAGLKHTLMQANHIISVSEFTRNEAIKYLSIKPENISTVYNGVSDKFKPRTASEVDTILRKHKLIYKRFLLSVCTLEPRKNLSSLIKGYLQLPLNLRQAYPLVLVGAVGWKVHELIDTIKAHSDTILLLGYLPEEDLSQLFSSAKAFCYLSTYEGFGLPVLEALASGVPVITAANTAMAEISSEQAILVDPLDIDAIQTGIQQILLDENCSTIANNLADYYRNNFSWKKCAKNTIEVIKNQVNDIGVL